MADDANFGSYWSMRTIDGHLFSSSRSEWSEVRADFEAMFGKEYVEQALAGVMGSAAVYTQVAEQGQVVSLPQQQDMEEAAVAVIAGGFEAVDEGPGYEPTAPVRMQPQVAVPGAQQFESCSKCGSPKDKWVPPGISRRTGKKYAGFFGCSNPNCR